MVRHFILSDLDGANPRHVTLGEYVDAIDRGEKFRINGLLGKLVARPTQPLCKPVLGSPDAWRG